MCGAVHGGALISECIELISFLHMQALESLNKKDMTEIKSYGRPPMLVEKVMEAVMILRGSEPTWAESKRQLGESEGSLI